MRAMLLERAATMLRARDPITLRSLVDGTGVSTMAVYTHFGGMEQLWQWLRQEGFTLLAARLAAITPPRDPVEHLATLAVAYLQHALDHPDLYRVMFDTTVDLPDPQAADDTLDFLVEAAARAVTAGRFADREPAHVLATRTWVVGHGLASLVATGPLPDDTLGLAPGLLESVFVGFGDDPRRCRTSIRRAWRTPPA